MDKLLLKVEEAADALSLGRSKTYELIQRGELQTVRVGRAVRVPAIALRAYADQLIAGMESNKEPTELAETTNQATAVA